MLTSSELINLVKEYDANVDANLLKKAYIFAMGAHGVQKRDSGAPYFYHPVEVARFLAELRLDSQIVAAGLLHDVLEDARVSFEELEAIFGVEVSSLVKGVTKLSKINYSSSKTRWAENFKKFVMATSRDVRTLIIKLMDRLSNMRTLSYVSSVERRKRIALETIDIYAPIAGRIGMNAIKDEMEDIAFYNLHPQEYASISSQLDKIRKHEVNCVQSSILELKRIFRRAEIEANINGREKRIYSIWKKMQKRNIPLEQINDLVAFRIIVDTVPQCYLSLGIIHTNFHVVPGRFKDYISVPKLNNYRSLHTTIVGPSKRAMEIQIRTKEMHKAANEGASAHWSYKDDEIIVSNNVYGSYGWINNLLSVLQNSASSKEAMVNSKLEMFDDEIFCFTPKGDLIVLPRGATVADFAYEIHSDIGNSCIGARVNGRVAMIRTILQNGDQVEIISSSSQRPEAARLGFVVTAKAKSCLQKIVREQEKAEFSTLGLQLIKYVFSTSDARFDEHLIDLEKFACSSIDKFYYKVGKGIIPLNALWKTFSICKNRTISCEDYVCLSDFTPGIAAHFAECCHPMGGDDVVGILTPKKGIVVHLADCNRIQNNKFPRVKIKWNQNDRLDDEFVGKLRVVVLNKTESFATIANIINSSEAIITNLKVERRTVGFFTLLTSLKVKNKTHFEETQAALRSCSDVQSVENLTD